MKQEQTTPKAQVMNVNVMNKLYAHIFYLFFFFTIDEGHISVPSNIFKKFMFSFVYKADGQSDTNSDFKLVKF